MPVAVWATQKVHGTPDDLTRDILNCKPGKSIRLLLPVLTVSPKDALSPTSRSLN